jgi:hypothetical protein
MQAHNIRGVQVVLVDLKNKLLVEFTHGHCRSQVAQALTFTDLQPAALAIQVTNTL